MRFVWAVVAFILAAGLIGAGVAQRTVLLGPSEVSEQFELAGSTAYVLVDGEVLGAREGAQTLHVEDAPGEIFAAYGRTADMVAWLADTRYEHVTLDEDAEGEPDAVTTVVEPQAPGEGEDAAATEGAEGGGEEAAPTPETRDPAGSDLWLEEYEGEASLDLALQLPDDMSVLVAVDGTATAPSAISMSWPTSNATPWAGPLIAAGGAFILLGVVLYVLGIRHVRRSRGPRRKGLPPLPPTEPIDTVSADGVSAAPRRRALLGGGRRTPGRRARLAVPAILVTGGLLAGCSPDAWPQISASPSPSPEPSVVAPEGQQSPVVTEAQAREIVQRIGQTVADADEAADASLAATRLAGPMLAEREANYDIRAEIDDHPALAAIQTEPVEVILPQAFDGWPRTFLAVVYDQDEESPAPSVMMAAQEDPWSDYRLVYRASIAGSAELPEVAPAQIGATQVPPDSSFLLLPPASLGSAYADVIDNGTESVYAGDFDVDADPFLSSVAENRQTQRDRLNETGAETAEISFAAEEGDSAPVALATLESGAIVATTLNELETVRATNPDAVIRLENNPAAGVLAGTDSSPEGFEVTYQDQLFFYVPNQAAGGRIQLLATSSSILSAKEIEQ